MASPLSPSQITDTNYNSYFCKNCGTRLIHTTPVSSPTFSIVIPVFKYCPCCTYLYCSLGPSCSYVLFFFFRPRYTSPGLSNSDMDFSCRTKESSP